MNAAVLAAASGDDHQETLALEFDLPGNAQFAALQAAVERAGADSVSGPFYMLRDDTEARRAARADALARARADAEAYATPLGMRVARILRVSERGSGDFGSLQIVQTWMQRMAGMTGRPEPEIETEMQVSVDFALAPQ